MASWNVSNATQLRAALGSAKGGDEIVLARGEYGAVQLSGLKYASAVTIRSADARNPADFDQISISNSENIRIDSVKVTYNSNPQFNSAVALVSVKEGSRNIEFVNSEVRGPIDGNFDGGRGLHSQDSSNVTFAKNFVHNIADGGVFLNTTGLKVIGNKIEDVRTDSLKFSGVKSVLIENNTAATRYHGAVGDHQDFIQFSGASSSDIVIRGNVMLPAKEGTIQGIFMDDTIFNNVLIENNVILTDNLRGIFVRAGSGVIIQKNTVLSLPGATLQDDGASKAAQIAAPSGSIVRKNVTSHNENFAEITSNGIVAQHKNSDGVAYYDDLYVNATKGYGMTIADLAPVRGSPAAVGSGMGAEARIAQLLAEASGGSSGSTGGTPTDGTGSTPPDDDGGVVTPPDDGETETPGGGDDGGTSGGIPPSTDVAVLYRLLGNLEVDAASDVVVVPPGGALSVPAATIALTFNADDVSGRSGIISKDAYSYTGGGHHLTAYIEDGVLKVRFQDEDERSEFKVPGVVANRDYDLQASFGDGKISVYLDGQLVGSRDFTIDWTKNTQYMQIGANGWGSADGDSSFVEVFDGTISNVVIAKGVQTVETMDALRSGTTDPLYSSTIFRIDAALEIDSSSDVLSMKHDKKLQLDESTIGFTFNADDLATPMGLFSKDARGVGQGEGQLSIFVNHLGNLVVRGESVEATKRLVYRDVETDRDYKVAVTFDDDEMMLFVDGDLIGSTEFDMNFDLNREYMQVGAYGGSSLAGDGSFSSHFDGTISDFVILDRLLAPQDIDLL